MNNIKSFNEYSGYELEQVVYDNELNEKKLLRGFFNKLGARKVRAELAEEIELSKEIMEGIQKGLESLDENFDVIKKSIDGKKGDDKVKGEKQKTLDEIKKIIENSRKSTWDLNQLIDEGEIDYTGFTANIGIATVRYWGILFTPFTSIIMIHKGYNYFFNIVKNTIRKALVMLQLNFDQFENLIITKGFQSDDYIQDIAANQKLDDTIDAVLRELCADKTGMIKNKSKAADYRKNIDMAYKRVKMENEKNKALKQSRDIFNNLDPYNNTYTKSLEALRQYSSDDVQKHLDSIKTSMNKLAGQDVDLQTYGELIIAAAEEHAYKVSTSIYNKFAKMTEVFSLPNQKKLIDLIMAANEEEQKAVDDAKKEYEDKIKKENVEKLEEDGVKIFGHNLGEFNKEKLKYENEDTLDAEDWTYEKFNKLSDEEKNTLESWLISHPNILKKCHSTLRAAICTSHEDGYYKYVDSLLDYIEPCIDEVKNEAFILDYDSYLLEESRKDDEKLWDKKFSNSEKIEDLWKAITHKCTSSGEPIIKDGGHIPVNINTQSVVNEIEYMLDKLKVATMDPDEDEDRKKEYSNWIKFLNDHLKKIETKLDKKHEKSKKVSLKNKKIIIDFGKIKNESQIDYLTELYGDTDAAYIAYKCIGKKLLNNVTFTKNSKEIVDVINSALSSKSKKVEVKEILTAKLIIEAIEKLKVLRSQDYESINNTSEAKKSE